MNIRINAEIIDETLDYLFSNSKEMGAKEVEDLLLKLQYNTIERRTQT